VSFVPTPIASGKPYHVVDVDDRAPEGLDNFVGDRQFVISTGGDATWRVHGVGRLDGDAVRFIEKDAAATKDVRVWRVRRVDDEGFVAEHSAAF
jgi:hypothetical protein